MGMFADFKFTEGRGKGQTFSLFLTSVVARLQDLELPVRVDASVALRSFVECVKDLDLLRGVLPQLLNEFMKLINEIENDDLIHTLESIVEKFGDEIAPRRACIGIEARDRGEIKSRGRWSPDAYAELIGVQNGSF